MTTVKVLELAKELISKDSNWTQLVFARDSEGEPVYFDSPNATSFCSAGAIRRVGGDSYEVDILGQFRGVDYVSSYNDNHTHADVMRLFDAAIAAYSVA